MHVESVAVTWGWLKWVWVDGRRRWRDVREKRQKTIQILLPSGYQPTPINPISILSELAVVKWRENLPPSCPNNLPPFSSNPSI